MMPKNRMGLSAQDISLNRCGKPIIKNLSFTLKAGQCVALTGPNGGGKSSLMEIVTGHLLPDQGTVHLGSSHIAYLPQRCLIDPTFPISVEDLVSTGLWPKLGLFASFTIRHKLAIKSALDLVAMTPFAHTPIARLSGGQLQRTLFARMLVQDADILLMDEPLTGIDENTQSILLDIMATLHHEGRTILTTLHDNTIISRLCSQTLLLARHFWRFGKTAEILNSENIQKAYAETQKWSDCPC